MQGRLIRPCRLDSRSIPFLFQAILVYFPRVRSVPAFCLLYVGRYADAECMLVQLSGYHLQIQVKEDRKEEKKERTCSSRSHTYPHAHAILCDFRDPAAYTPTKTSLRFGAVGNEHSFLSTNPSSKLSVVVYCPSSSPRAVELDARNKAATLAIPTRLTLNCLWLELVLFALSIRQFFNLPRQQPHKPCLGSHETVAVLTSPLN